MKRIITMMTLATLAGCGDDTAPVTRTAAPERAAVVPTTQVPATDSWIGRWLGPEGLFLDIRAYAEGGEGHYVLTIKSDLDGQAEFVGQADGETIRFVRGGAQQTIRPGKGVETGFKWLADKSNCLIIRSGQEGYCR
ncbi:hypothetical protein NA655_08965 [Pseudomonas kuykendallii]|uniref:Lipoprotein n=1 Tax=Pseudomonas kuykendallii TaxID=1007099 RepID=A0A1H3EG16_9PSED|nr:hypothetical protein [Pseudomonas kuykendallii]MCQ4271150.1 hypothetical protein [Pseudomonas kuykendallii]SDX76854.1 hypothetical protein SAMN05216287_3669 [Pseudomonas kuykendallii]